MKRKRKSIIFQKIGIENNGGKGKAIGYAEDGKVILVPFATKGDVVDIQILKKRKAYYEGVVTELITPSADRVKPKCIHFGVCGGCQWQHLDYQKQLLFKQEEVEMLFRNISGIGYEVEKIIPADEIYLYRNKIELSCSNNKWLTKEELDSGTVFKNKQAIGFHKPKMWDKVLDLNDCHLQIDPSDAIRKAIKLYAVEQNIPFYDLRKKVGVLRNILLRSNKKGGFLVFIQFSNDYEDYYLGLLDYLNQKFEQIETILYAVNNKTNDSYYDLKTHLHSGKGYIVEEIHNLKFQIDTKSFFQTNSYQTEKLYEVVKNMIGNNPNAVLYDLYCGTGTIGLCLANSVASVLGLEILPEAVDIANKNKNNNKINNISFLVGDVKRVLSKDTTDEYGRPNIVVIDPPREGLHADVIEILISLKPETIVYISCNPATQARDVVLINSQYKVKNIQPIDMFPQTYHIENIAHLERI